MENDDPCSLPGPLQQHLKRNRACSGGQHTEREDVVDGKNDAGKVAECHLMMCTLVLTQVTILETMLPKCNTTG
jgi:hypothetical protein